VVAALAGDWKVARDVQLQLPETGVCSSNLALDDADAESCCGAAAEQPAAAGIGRGLATGLAGGLSPLPIIEWTPTASGCCG
jgi:hypothetical protein